jgi:hypothetical protein
MIEFQIENGTKRISKSSVWVLKSTKFYKGHVIGCCLLYKCLFYITKNAFWWKGISRSTICLTTNNLICFLKIVMFSNESTNQMQQLITGLLLVV